MKKRTGSLQKWCNPLLSTWSCCRLLPCYFLLKGAFFAALADRLTARTDLSPFRLETNGGGRLWGKCLLQPFSLRHCGWRKVDSPEILFHSVGFEKLDSIRIDTLAWCANLCDYSGRELNVASVL
jgi:hypothetical protein